MISWFLASIVTFRELVWNKNVVLDLNGKLTSDFHRPHGLDFTKTKFIKILSDLMKNSGQKFNS